jgi:uncharacterized protein YqeY
MKRKNNMLKIQELLIRSMKKELFPDKDELNTAARQILGEMKTKIKDIKEEITTDIQYKLLTKMKKDRENSVKIYSEAVEKTNSDVAKENLKKAKIELEPIDLFLKELEAEMPKKMSEEEIRIYVKDLINYIKPEKPTIGLIMNAIKSDATLNVDMSMASKIIKEELN